MKKDVVDRHCEPITVPEQPDDLSLLTLPLQAYVPVLQDFGLHTVLSELYSRCQHRFAGAALRIQSELQNRQHNIVLLKNRERVLFYPESGVLRQVPGRPEASIQAVGARTDQNWLSLCLNFYCKKDPNYELL